jgi:hypothetical protein
MMRLFRHLQLWLTGSGSHLQPATLWSHSLHEDSNAWKGSTSRGRRCVGAIESGRTSVGGLAGEASCSHRAKGGLLRQANTGLGFVGALAP